LAFSRPSNNYTQDHGDDRAIGIFRITL